jgi:hypothetical protein
MSKHHVIRALLSAGLLAGAATGAHAYTFIPNDPNLPDIRITEYMYKNEGSPAEFVQFTNLGSTAVNMSTFSEDDETGTPGVHSLASMGTLQPGQSGILAETTAATFDAAWNLPSTTPFAQENTSDNLGSKDTIYLFDDVSGTEDIVDELAYGTTGPKTDGVAAVPGSASVIGTNNSAGWVLLAAGTDGAYKSNGGSGDTGSPGYSSFAVPLPGAAWLLMSGLGALVPSLRRRKSAAQAMT